MSPRWCVAILVLAPWIYGCGGSDDAAPSTGGAGGVGGGSGGGVGLGGTSGSGGAGGAVGCSAPARAFWTWDLAVMPPTDVQIPASCRGETDHAYVYVADTSWNVDIDQAQVSKILEAFEFATPADSTRGIYQTDVDTFGEPPDVDGDPHVILFYVPMGSFQSFSFDGFFRGDDETPGATTNGAEMLHLNVKANQAPDSDYMLGVVAHEFVHLIGWKYDGAEEGWLSESLAESAMVKAGYMTDLVAAQGYTKKTATVPLCVKSYSDYGATFSWGAYLLDRFGPALIKAVNQDPAHGRGSIEAHLPGGTTFRDVFGEFMVATLLDEPSIGDGRYGFASVDIGSLGSETAGVIDAGSHDSSAVAFGARTVRFTTAGAGTLNLTLTSADTSKLVVHSVVLNPASPAGAKIATEDPSAGPISLALASGQVANLVVAVDPGAALADSKSAPSTSFSYTATFTP
ncbi:MAG: hypothetical protein R3B13_27645 [Polyangiaceae bacterium]